MVSPKRPFKVAYTYSTTRVGADEATGWPLLDDSKPITLTSSSQDLAAVRGKARMVSRNGGTARVYHRDPVTGEETTLREDAAFEVAMEELTTGQMSHRRSDHAHLRPVRRHRRRTRPRAPHPHRRPSSYNAWREDWPADMVLRERRRRRQWSGRPGPGRHRRPGPGRRSRWSRSGSVRRTGRPVSL
jgi:hypothetical protein